MLAGVSAQPAWPGPGGGRTPLVIEIKSRFDGDLRLAKRTAEIIAGHKDRPIVLKSFDPVIVAALRELAPDFARRPAGLAGGV